MESEKKMKAVYIIVNAGFSEHAMEIARECGAGGGTVYNARGTWKPDGSKSSAARFEPEKEIIITVVDAQIAENIMTAIKSRVGLGTPGNGICFSVDVDNMTSINKQ